MQLAALRHARDRTAETRTIGRGDNAAFSSPHRDEPHSVFQTHAYDQSAASPKGRSNVATGQPPHRDGDVTSFARCCRQDGTRRRQSRPRRSPPTRPCRACRWMAVLLRRHCDRNADGWSRCPHENACSCSRDCEGITPIHSHYRYHVVSMLGAPCSHVVTTWWSNPRIR